MFDVIVAGAGLTGLVAAYMALKAGARVQVIAKGLGALHWSAGTVDVLGYFPDENNLVQRPLEMLPQVNTLRPGHPYSLLGEAGVQEGLAAFLKLTKEAGLPYVGSAHAGDNLWLPSPAGAARPTYLAPLAQLGGDLRRREPMLIAGFHGLRDFYPELIAENLTKQGHPARAAFLSLDLLTGMRDRNTVQLAREVESPARRDRLAVELKKLLRPGERIGLPALLGIEEHAAVIAALGSQTGATIFEIPTLPPSVPGFRLNAALRRLIAQAGGRVDINMDVIAAHAEGDRVLWIESEASGRPLKHRAEKFLLATGGLLGGGIATDPAGKAWETVLNVPLALPASRAEWFQERFFDPGGHPVFRAGVPVDSHFQPVDAQGVRVYINAWAAGTLLAHADPILERSLEGIAITTGRAAIQHMLGIP